MAEETHGYTKRPATRLERKASMKTKGERRRLPYEDAGEDCCSGCGMPDPMGVHYADCVLLEPGDLMAPRDRDDWNEVDLPFYDGPCRQCEWLGFDCGHAD